LTSAVAAKTALFDRLIEEADGGLLQGVDVSYGWEPAGLRSIYGGGWRSQQESAIAEEDGILQNEVTSVSVYVRVVLTPVPPVDAVKAADAEVERIANLISRVMRHQPRLAGGFTWLGMSSTSGDYQPGDDSVTSIAAFAMRIRSMLTWT
jgi:hypothetical protein